MDIIFSFTSKESLPNMDKMMVSHLVKEKLQNSKKNKNFQQNCKVDTCSLQIYKTENLLLNKD